MVKESNVVFLTDVYLAHLNPLNAIQYLLKTILEIAHDYQTALA